MRACPGWAAGLVWVAGCDASGFGPDPFDSGDSRDSGLAESTSVPTSDPTTTSDQSTAMMGTQVGSEGFWSCPVLGVQAVDGATVLPAFDAAPAALAAARVGTWPVQMVDVADAEQVAGTLDLEDDGVYLWVDVADDATCADHLVVGVRGELNRADAWKLPMSGVLAVRPDQGRTILTGDGPLADVEATWGPSPLDPTLTAFRVDVAIDPSVLDGTASYVDCAAVSCGGSAPLATLVGAR